MRVHPQQHTQAGWHTVGQAYLTDITAAVHWVIQHEPSTSQPAEMACKQARQDASLNKVRARRGCGLFEFSAKFANISISGHLDSTTVEANGEEK